MERIPKELPGRLDQQSAMEPGLRKRLPDRPYLRRGQPEPDQPQRHVDQVGPAERLHRPLERPPEAPDQADHGTSASAHIIGAPRTYSNYMSSLETRGPDGPSASTIEPQRLSGHPGQTSPARTFTASPGRTFATSPHFCRRLARNCTAPEPGQIRGGPPGIVRSRRPSCLVPSMRHRQPDHSICRHGCIGETNHVCVPVEPSIPIAGVVLLTDQVDANQPDRRSARDRPEIVRLKLPRRPSLEIPVHVVLGI